MTRAVAGAEIGVTLILQVTIFTAETALIPAVQKRFGLLQGKRTLPRI